MKLRIHGHHSTIGPMPSYLRIPQEDRWALVHYTQSVFKPDFPQAPPSADALAKPPKTKDGKPDTVNPDGASKE